MVPQNVFGHVEGKANALKFCQTWALCCTGDQSRYLQSGYAGESDRIIAVIVHENSLNWSRKKDPKTQWQGKIKSERWISTCFQLPNWYDVTLSRNLITKFDPFSDQKLHPNRKSNFKTKSPTNPNAKRRKMNDEITLRQFDKWQQVRTNLGEVECAIDITAE